MSALIFRLRHVPDDEADAVRDLLDAHNVEWYETTAGNWGISMPGIWATNDQQISKARALINDYQHERATSQRSEYLTQRQLGKNVTLSQRIIQYPIRSLGIFIFCAFILYVSIHPFIQMIGYSSQ